MLKLSGEALQGGMGFGVDPKVCCCYRSRHSQIFHTLFTLRRWHVLHMQLQHLSTHSQLQAPELWLLVHKPPNGVVSRSLPAFVKGH